MTGKINFTVPETAKDASGNPHPEAGKTIPLEFEYSSVSTIDEANQVIADKEWSVVTMVNKALKANAHSARYQAEAAKYSASNVTPDQIKTRMINDLVRLGFSVEVATDQIDSLLAAK